MAISTITSAGIATDTLVAGDIAADAVGSSEIAANAVGTSEIATGGVLPANIAYLGDGSGNLSGTITNQQLHFGTAFTLTDNLTINGDVTLGKVRDDGLGQSITGSGRTLTGTGTLTMGSYVEGEPKNRTKERQSLPSTSASDLDSGTLAVARMAIGTILGAACLVDVTNGSDGSSSTSNTLRTLNTVLYEVGFGVTIDTNEWTFDEAGSYLISASAPAFRSDRHICRLYSGTGVTLEATGTAQHSGSADTTTTTSYLNTKLVITDAQKTSGGSEKTFGIYTIVDVATSGTGLGVSNEDTTVEQYTQVQIFKIQE